MLKRLKKPGCINKDLTQYTPSEALWVWRHRQGLSFIAAAKKLKVGPNLYSKMENDRHELTERAVALLARQVKVKFTGLDLLLARRRYGEGLRGTATLLKVSHMTLLAWEKERDPRLVQFWKDKGFNVR